MDWNVGDSSGGSARTTPDPETIFSGFDSALQCTTIVRWKIKSRCDFQRSLPTRYANGPRECSESRLKSCDPRYLSFSKPLSRKPDVRQSVCSHCWVLWRAVCRISL